MKRFRLTPVLTICCGILSLLSALTAPLSAQETTPPAEAPAAAPPAQETASIYYADAEPKQLFKMLSEDFHVQFEGVEAVEGPVTLISQEKVNVDGMIQLLNDVLNQQDREAVRDGQIIRIRDVSHTKTEWVHLEHGDAQSIVDWLKNRYLTPSDGRDPDPRVTDIQRHPELPRVFVEGREEAIQEIKKLIQEQLDLPPGTAAITDPDTGAVTVTDVAPAMTSAWIDLTYADVDQTVQWLRQRYLGADSQPADPRVTDVRAHPSQSSILIAGEQSAIDEITGLIQTHLDMPPTIPIQPPVTIKYVTLEYLDAEDFQDLLENNENIKGRIKSALAPNNTLIVSSRDDNVFAEIEEVRKAIDIDRMELRYYPLSYANAADIAKVLSAIYPAKPEELPSLPAELERARRGRRAEGEEQEVDIELARELALARAGALDVQSRELLSRSLALVAQGEVRITPDVAPRNGLFIYTFSRNFPRIIELIEKLDVPPQQVIIDVFITEVIHDDNTELGVDFTQVGNTSFHDSSYTLRQGLGTATNTLGLSYQLINDNITAFLRALQETDRLDIITRPQVMTTNKKKAVIEFGDIVPLVDKTTVSTEGATNSTVSYKPVTTNLTVTPQIHPDGFVTLEIIQKIDDVGTETFQISENFNPQILITRRAETLLRVKDGQTVCLGGFIIDRLFDSENRVPLISDIPLLGEAFKYAEREKRKAELIIFITPHIIDTPQEALRFTNQRRTDSYADQREGRPDEILEVQDTLVYPRYKDPIAGSRLRDAPLLTQDPCAPLPPKPAPVKKPAPEPTPAAAETRKKPPAPKEQPKPQPAPAAQPAAKPAEEPQPKK